MFRIVATFIKEIQLLAKDKTGITVLFVMPMILVVLMTLIQNEVYKSLNESGIPVLLVNHDNGQLGRAIEKGFKDNPICDLTVDHGEIYPTTESIKERVLHGEYLVALVIPDNATELLTSDVEGMLDVFINEDTASVEDIFEDIHFEIIVDPVARK
ncbi:MAG: SNG1 family protein, partial [Cyclobacteriaceae bacterium]|nr:SNG1 family protein [Cyclobacteriaceae bacterium]